MTVNGYHPGPAFQGLGAISGGGGNSRYLIDYPPAQRARLLDYLFSPHYGASLQMLKLEIGGDGNSSDGAEPSVEQVPGQTNCGGGYEFWLAKQALRRNPAIKLYALQWSAPGWVRSPSGTLWTSADIGYLINWLGCARHAGLPISYIGGWNEHYSPGSPVVEDWFVALRRALDRNGYTGVKIVASDAAGFTNPRVWAVASDMASNPAFARAVAVIGVHDVCGVESDGNHCWVTPEARSLALRLGKPLWQSEFGRTPALGTDLREEGPGGLARTVNNEYINASITGMLVWPLVDAMPAGLPYSDRGLVTADQPWSGYYRVNPLTWVLAQTTQFTAPGWRFVAGAAGPMPGGSYVAYEAPRRTAWSMVAQTSMGFVPRRLEVRLVGLPATVHVWMTQLTAHGRRFVDLGSVAADAGRWSYVLQPGAVYTFTSTTGQTKAGGAAPAVPPPAPMPLPYAARPDGAGMASMLSPMEGSFQYVRGALTQTTASPPVPWISYATAFPYAVVGDPRWRNYTVKATVALPPTKGGRPPGALLIACFAGFHEPYLFTGYEFTLDAAGRWRIIRNGAFPTSLASGAVRPAHRYTMALSVDGPHISAWVDGQKVQTANDGTYRVGLAGLGSLRFDPVRYTSFTVTRRP